MSRGVNKVILIGNLGADPDVRYTPNGSAVVNLNLATDESYKDKNSGQMVPKTEWHRVVVFGKPGEIIGQYCRKGSKLYIEGKLQTRKWQNKEGQDVYTTEVILSVGGDFQLLDGKPAEGASQRPPVGQTHQQNRVTQGAYQQHSQSSGQGQQPTGNNMPEPIDDFDDDIPFDHEAA